MLARIQGRITHRELDRVSPLAVPVMLEIGRESVYGEAADELLAEAADELEVEARATAFEVADVSLVADLSGALSWEGQRLLVASDLHREKGSSFAARGVLLPPYDTAATLGRLAAGIARHDPRMVIALGDSFHDRDAHLRLSDID
ncbi:hypothetical protein E4T56_gene8736, partial [Termitomyces sp. T112]